LAGILARFTSPWPYVFGGIEHVDVREYRLSEKWGGKKMPFELVSGKLESLM
jgi:hypothetical protein